MLTKIFLIGNYKYDRQESMQRFSAVLFRALKDSGYPVRLIQPNPVFGALKPGGTGIGKWLGYIDKFLLFPFKLRHLAKEAKVNGNTVFHICDHSNAMYGRHLKDVPHVVTCNDMLAIRSALGEFPENKTRWSGKLLQKWILGSLKSVPHIACISTATQADTVRLAGRNTGNSIIIHMGLNYPYQPLDKTTRVGILQKLQRSKGISFNFGTPFLFHIGGSKWYKNRDGLIRIYGMLRSLNPSCPHLVIAGKPHSLPVQKLIQNSGLGEYIHYAGEISNEELNALYSDAVAFLFPSLAEGFGWPIIEAQASACRVVTSNRQPMIEVGGEAAAYVDPDSPESAAAAIQDIITEPDDSRILRIRMGIQNAARFSVDKMISAYISEYQNLMGKDVPDESTFN